MPRIQPKPPMDYSGMDDATLRGHVRVLAAASYAARLKWERAAARAEAAEHAAVHAEAELARRQTGTR